MLDKKTLTEVKKIVFQYLDPHKDKVFIFGSWALGNARKFSDIDIGIESKRKVSSNILSEISETFENSNIPYTVEVVDFANVSDTFKKLSLQKIITLN